MDGQDVSFMPCFVSVCTTFLENCGWGVHLMATTCVRTAIGVSKGHATCEILVFLHIFVCV